MSRIPQPSSTRPSLKPPSTPGKSRIETANSPVRIRTKSTGRSATPTKPKVLEREIPPPSPSQALSIKEAIALKRAEAKKALSKSSSGSGLGALEESLPDVASKQQEDEDLLGRLSVRETIEQARSTGEIIIQFMCRAELK
jgi:hypothetical protein